MAINFRYAILFMLLDYSEPKFVGIAWDNELEQTLRDLRKLHSPFAFQVLGKFMTLHEAQDQARILIKRYHTNLFGWNKTDYGDLESNNSAYSLVGTNLPPGAVKTDPANDEWRAKISRSLSRVAKRNNYGKRLRKIMGDEHAMKTQETRDKLRDTCIGRKRYYFDDGTWTWVYPKDHEFAYRNRDNKIPHLEDVPPERLIMPKRSKD